MNRPSPNTVARPFWDTLGTWEGAPLQTHELNYLMRKRALVAERHLIERQDNELELAILRARATDTRLTCTPRPVTAEPSSRSGSV